MNNIYVRAAVGAALALGAAACLAPAFSEGVRLPTWPYPQSEYVGPGWADKAMSVSVSMEAAVLAYRCEYRGPEWLTQVIMIGWQFEMELFHRNNVSEFIIGKARTDFSKRVEKAKDAELTDHRCNLAADYLPTLDTYARR